MGWLCDQVVKAGGTAIADFICPIAETREAFGPAFTIWLDRIPAGRFEDTNTLFTPPERHDERVTAEGTARAWAERISKKAARSRPPVALNSPSCGPLFECVSATRKTPILTRFWARRPRSTRTWQTTGVPLRRHGRAYRKAGASAEPVHVRRHAGRSGRLLQGLSIEDIICQR